MMVGDEQRNRWSLSRAVALCCGPALISGLMWLCADLVPSDEVWGHMAHSILLSAYTWAAPVTILLCCRVAFRSQRWWPPVCIGLLAVPWLGWPGTPPAATGTRVLVGNVNAYTEGKTDLAQAIVQIDADVVIQVEARALDLPGYTRVADNLKDQLPQPSYASAVFCRDGVSCEGAVTELFGSPTKRMPVALARLSGGACVLGMHAPPPVPLDASGLLPHMQRIASHIRAGRMVKPWGPCRVGDPVVMAGDFNAVPGSWAIQQLAPTGLTDLLDGWGLFALSWPFGGDLMVFPVFQLDHLYVGPVPVTGIEMVKLPGADHRAILATIGTAQP